MLLPFLAFQPATAAEESTKPRAVLVLVPGLASEPLLRALRDGTTPTLAEGSLGLMNAVVPAPVSRESAYLTVGQGRRLKYGVPDPSPTPIPSLIEACGRAGIRFGYVGPVPSDEKPPGWQLLQADEAVRGTAMGAVADTAQESPAWVQATATALQDADLVIVDLPRSGGHASTAMAALGVAEGIAQLLNRDRDFLLLTSPDPGEPVGGQWMGLSPAVAWGTGVLPGLLTSATTRTPGLIANVDIAPTFLANLGITAPPGLEGHPLRVDKPEQDKPAKERATWLLNLAAQLRQNRLAMVPVLVSWGLLALVAVVVTTWTLLAVPHPALVRIAATLLQITAWGPFAFLLVAFKQSERPEINPTIPTWAALCSLGIMSYFVGMTQERNNGLRAVYTISVAAMLADLFLGVRTLTFNLMSDMPNLGARFYGIGNEYQGMLLGASILLPCLRLGKQPPSFLWWVGTVTLWLTVLVAVGTPFLGADFGGAVSGALAFILSGCLIARFRPKPWQVVVGAGLFLLGVGGLVGLDLLRPPGDRTHVGELAARALAEGPGPVWEIAFRKLLLNVRMAQTPYFLAGVAAVTPLLWLWYSKLGPATRQALAQRPALQQALLGTAGGAVIVGLLNDTGVIAWALMTVSALLIWLNLLLEQHLTVGKVAVQG